MNGRFLNETSRDSKYFLYLNQIFRRGSSNELSILSYAIFNFIIFLEEFREKSNFSISFYRLNYHENYRSQYQDLRMTLQKFVSIDKLDSSPIFLPFEEKTISRGKFRKQIYIYIYIETHLQCTISKVW